MIRGVEEPEEPENWRDSREQPDREEGQNEGADHHLDGRDPDVREQERVLEALPPLRLLQRAFSPGEHAAHERFALFWHET